MHFSELLTENARRVMPLARAKGVVSYFDYHGPMVELAIPEDALQRAMHRVFLALEESVVEGFVMLTADVATISDTRCRATVHGAAAGECASDSTIAKVLHRLGLEDVERPSAPAPGKSWTAIGDCPATGAKLRFTRVYGEGLVFSWTLESKASYAAETRRPNAAGTVAWMVSEAPGGLDSVERRLGRNGWRLVRQPTLDIAQHRLHIAVQAGHPPSLLIVAETAKAELAQLTEMSLSSPSTWMVLGVLAGSHAIEARVWSPIDIRVLPLSPEELATFTRHFDLECSTEASRATSPIPLYGVDRHRVLVVDDNAVNQLLAQGLLEVLGYDADMVSDGAEAIAHCRDHPPDLVLMDIHMPVMDGLIATRELRRLQAQGSIAPFPIVIATTDHHDEVQEQAMVAGADGFMQKPLDFHTIENELRRLMPSRPETS